MKRSLLVAFILLTMLTGNARSVLCQQPTSSNAPQSASATTAHADKIYNQVFKLGVGQDVTVRLISGKEWHGRITAIEADSFKIVEVDLGQVVLFNYRETKKVYRGYTEPNVVGQRINPHTRKITGAIIGGALVGFLIFLASLTK